MAPPQTLSSRPEGPLAGPRAGTQEQPHSLNPLGPGSALRPPGMTGGGSAADLPRLLRLQRELRGHDAPRYVLMDDQARGLARARDEEPAAGGRDDGEGGG